VLGGYKDAAQKASGRVAPRREHEYVQKRLGTLADLKKCEEYLLVSPDTSLPKILPIYKYAVDNIEI